MTPATKTRGAAIRSVRRPLVALAALAALPLLLLPAASAAPEASTIRVTVSDKSIRLATGSTPVGVVTFVVRNAGTARHDFRIAGRKTPFLARGKSVRLTVNLRSAGRYAYRSTTAGNPSRALRGVLVVRAAVPPVTYPPITVLAASSLTDVFPAIDKAQTYSFSGSNALATQIRNGAPADVFASANVEIPSQLYAQGLVEKPVNFTRNKLVVVVPKSNPAGITSMYDLTKSGVKIDMAVPSAPVGAYALQVLKQMGITSKVLANVVSQESDVRAVLAKVALGQADAGFVYATDARSAPDDVKVIKVPAWAQPKVTYAIAVVASSDDKAAARAFIAKLLSPQGQDTLLRYGFLLPPGATPAKPALKLAS